MGVEELGVLRQLGAHDVLEALDEALRAAKDVLHEPESTDGGSRAIRLDARFETGAHGGAPGPREEAVFTLESTRTAHVDDTSFARGRGRGPDRKGNLSCVTSRTSEPRAPPPPPPPPPARTCCASSSASPDASRAVHEAVIVLVD